MKNLQETLTDEVFKQQARDSHEKQQQDKLDALTSSLAETTTVDERNISAVVSNLQNEVAESAAKRKLPFVQLPSIDARTLRIAAYVVAGFLAYSFYKSAQIDTFQQEQQLDVSQQSKFDLQIEIGTLRGMLTGPYQSYYRRYESFPHSMQSLEAVSTVKNLFGYSPMFGESVMQDNGTIRLELAESYGYHRWIELAPKLAEHPLSVKIDLNCRSNAQTHLLHNDGRYWCEHASD